MASVLSRPGDTLELILWREQGSAARPTAALELNPRLAELGPVLPAGTEVLLPDPPAAREETPLRLWGAS
jgi:phage tail protein X